MQLLLSNLVSSTVTYSFDKQRLEPSVQQAAGLDLRVAGGDAPPPPGLTAHV